MSTQLSPHFTVEELSCPHCKQLKLDPNLLPKLERLRVALGFPLIIDSGYRCPEHNKAVGGASGSQHVLGRAVDVSCKDSYIRFKIVEEALRQGFKGIEISPVHVHLDIRDSNPVFLGIDMFKTGKIF